MAAPSSSSLQPRPEQTPDGAGLRARLRRDTRPAALERKLGLGEKK